MIGNFLDYIVKIIISSNTAFQKMIKEEKIFILSMIYFFIIGIIYLLVVAIFVKKKFYPLYPPLLAITKEKYYFAEIFFQAPITFLCFVMTEGIIRLFSKLLNRNNHIQFHNLLGIIVYSLFISILILLVHDGIYALLFYLINLHLKNFINHSNHGELYFF